MKKFMVLLLAIVVLASSFVFPAFAEEQPDNIGGFDFYSITFHYSEPVVVSYSYNRREDVYTFGEAVKSYSIYVSENKKTQVYETQTESPISDSKQVKGNGSVVNSKDAGIDSSSLKYSKYPSTGTYLTHISNNSAFRIDNANVYGLRKQEDFYDDEGTRNPNLVVNEAGYFVDAITGQNIDDNGYLLDENGLWHDKNGVRIEPFLIKEDGSLEWISIADRKDENGRIKLLDNIGDVGLYRIAYDKNGDNVASVKELAECDKLDRVFTEKDIMENVTPAGPIKVAGSPEVGSAKTKAKIVKVTVEIDALGTQLYENIADDPQQKNTITLTTGSILENFAKAEALVEEINNDEKSKNEVMVKPSWLIIGSAKSVTTKTSMAFTRTAPLTYKSVEVATSDEVLAAIPASASLFLNFKVETLQKAEGFDYSKSFDSSLKLGTSNLKKVSERDLEIVSVAPSTDDGSDINIFLIVGIAAGVVVIVAIVVLILIISLKKKKKAAPVAPAFAVEQETAPVVEDVEIPAEAEVEASPEATEEPKEDTEA